MLRPYLSLIRIPQWVKNGFLFLPIFFDRKLFQADVLINTLVAALAFSFVSSMVYIFNDYKDREEDRKHPLKKFRPIASGVVKPKQAIMVVFVLVCLAFGSLYYLQSLALTIVLAIYLVMNVFYSLGLKHISLLDIFIIAFGYILRVYAGGIASGIQPSEWLILMSLLLALFLALAKRRDDVIIFEQSGKKMRKSVDGYNQQFLNTALSMLGGIMVVAYSMYVLSDETKTRFGSDYLFLTVIFVLAGMLRYIQITLVEDNSGSPTNALYRDKFLKITIALWLLSLFSIIYLHKI